MKKILMATVLALGIATGAHAQIIKPVQGKKIGTSIKNGFNDVVDVLQQDVEPTGTHEILDFFITPKVGLNLSTLTSMGGHPQLGITAGLAIETFLTQRLSLGLELLYSHQGTSSVRYDLVGSDGNPYEYGPAKFSMGYLSTNLLVRYYPKACLPFSVYTGLCISRCVSATYKEGSQKTDLQDDHVHTGDLGIPLGATYEVGQWAFDLRLQYSPTQIAKSERAKEIMGHASNVKVEATVGYRINFF